MLSLSDDNSSEVIEAFSSTSSYLDDLLNIDNNFRIFDSMVNHTELSELQSQIPRPLFGFTFIYIG